MPPSRPGADMRPAPARSSSCTMQHCPQPAHHGLLAKLLSHCRHGDELLLADDLQLAHARSLKEDRPGQRAGLRSARMPSWRSPCCPAGLARAVRDSMQHIWIP